MAYPKTFVSHSLLMYLNVRRKVMILMVDLSNFSFDFIHGFLVKQVFIISLIVLVNNDLVR